MDGEGGDGVAGGAKVGNGCVAGAAARRSKERVTWEQGERRAQTEGNGSGDRGGHSQRGTQCGREDGWRIRGRGQKKKQNNTWEQQQTKEMHGGRDNEGNARASHRGEKQNAVVRMFRTK